MQSDSSLFLIGIAAGLGLSIVGGVVDYWFSLRKSDPMAGSRVPGCMLYMAGLLGLMGLVAIILSLIFSGSVGPALIMGAGVLTGFYAGFALLMVLYLLIERGRTN